MKLTIAFILTGLIVFTLMAVFDQTNWSRSYALWDKSKDIALCYLVWEFSYKKYRNLILPLLWFLIVRLAWDVISWITGLSVNNPAIVGVLFIIYAVYVLYKAITSNGRS